MSIPHEARRGDAALALLTRLHRQARARNDRRALALGAWMIAGGVGLLVCCAERIAALLSSLLDLPLTLLIAVAWPHAVAARRARRQLAQRQRRSWLASLPIDASAFARAALRSLCAKVAVAVVALLAVVSIIAGASGLPGKAVLTLGLLIGGGAIVGSAFGWRLGGDATRRRRRDRLPAATRIPPLSYPLGRWPLRQAGAQADSGLHARVIGALLLTMPIGTPVSMALGLLVAGTAAIVVWELQRGLAATLAATNWLRSLPLRRWPAAGLLGRRALIATGLASFCAVGVAMALGAPLSRVQATGIVLGAITLTTATLLVCTAARQAFGARR